ncbi:DNA alkylation repair protein [Streptococcus oricebi]|uniref:DNA alkylation repair protein n=1 Tax=Streptococcus oricebi TaxID=1547447 RepID=A0ABS5B3I8_9STRE|nr:DNA alkylation repair protein [Streptococcus oricebi]MBP2623394.1 DNA alkylation repair protein [Streptococcus oricebi]
MAKKLKDYYDENYVIDLATKLQSVYSPFNAKEFIAEVRDDLENQEFTGRQVLIARTLKKYIALNYEETIDLFSKILGPELEGSLGMFTEGYWLWPIGKYVELYGAEHFEVTSLFSKELTKRFTGEFCMRPLVHHYPKQAMELLLEWSKDENKRVRRLASECLRIRLPWAKKLYVTLDYFDDYVTLLTNLKNDEDKTIQKSVANSLNDLYKEAPEKFDVIIKNWQEEDLSPQTAWIIKHASRTKEKHAK